MNRRHYLPLFILGLALNPLSAATAAPDGGRDNGGGAACVVAKKLGNSLAIEWSTGAPSVSQAIARAKQALREKGFKYVFPQANSSLPHGWMIVIKTQYKTFTGKIRTSYGCGFSAVSAKQAEQLAVRDLRAFSWGWKPQYGYDVIENKRY